MKSFSRLLRNNLILLSAGLFAIACQSDPFAEPDNSGMFIKFYGKSGDEQGFAARETENGQFIIAGTTESTEDGASGIFVVKTDENGNRIWQEQFTDTVNIDQGSRDMEILPNGDAFIFGYKTLANGFSDFYLLRIDENGSKVDSLTYGDSLKNEEGLDIIPSFSGGYLLVGTVENSSSDKDMLIIKIDESGNELFSNTYGLINEFDEITAVAENNQGELVWCGTLTRGGSQSMRVVSTDSLGAILWDYTYEDEISGVESIANSMKKITGGYVITGKTFIGSTESNVLLVQISDRGNLRWAADLSSTLSQEGNAVARTSDGGYAVIGETSTSIGRSDMYLLKTNSLGELLWSKSIGGDYNDTGNFVTEAADGGLVILGTSEISNNTVIEFIKTDTEGATPGDGGGK